MSYRRRAPVAAPTAPTAPTAPATTTGTNGASAVAARLEAVLRLGHDTAAKRQTRPLDDDDALEATPSTRPRVADPPAPPDPPPVPPAPPPFRGDRPRIESFDTKDEDSLRVLAVVFWTKNGDEILKPWLRQDMFRARPAHEILRELLDDNTVSIDALTAIVSMFFDTNLFAQFCALELGQEEAARDRTASYKLKLQPAGMLELQLKNDSELCRRSPYSRRYLEPSSETFPTPRAENSAGEEGQIDHVIRWRARRVLEKTGRMTVANQEQLIANQLVDGAFAKVVTLMRSCYRPISAYTNARIRSCLVDPYSDNGENVVWKGIKSDTVLEADLDVAGRAPVSTTVLPHVAESFSAGSCCVAGFILDDDVPVIQVEQFIGRENFENTVCFKSECETTLAPNLRYEAVPGRDLRAQVAHLRRLEPRFQVNELPGPSVDVYLFFVRKV